MQVGSHHLPILEPEAGMQAGAGHDVEGSGEGMLVNVGRSIQPEQGLYVEAGMIEEDQFGLAEAGKGLERLVILMKEVSDEVADSDVPGRGALAQGLGGDLRKGRGREVRELPLIVDRGSEFPEEGVHAMATLPEVAPSRQASSGDNAG